MHERKTYPNLSDEELDRRAEEALKRMLDKPPTAPKAQRPHDNQQNNRQRHRKKPRR